jgi:hypothetical protein
MTTPEPGSGNTRRTVLKKAAALGLGTGALVVTSQLVTATPAHAATQSGWRYCSRCRCLHWPSSNGRCPEPTYLSHSWSGSFNYTMYFKPDTMSGQDRWAYCHWCKAMFYWGSTTEPYAGVCPEGGGHNGYESYQYVIPTGSASNRQSNWRHCVKCQSLFWGGAESSSHCAAGGRHNRGESWNYWLRYATA